MNEVLDPEIVEDDESSLRPSDFDEYIGQTNLKENLLLQDPSPSGNQGKGRCQCGHL